MTVTINGTTGIANDGGYTGDGVVFADTTPANTLVTTTGGNVGIGTGSPVSKLHIESTSAEAFQIGYSSTKRARLGVTSSGDLQIYAYETAVGYKNIQMCVDAGTAGGNLLVGTTSNSGNARIAVSGTGSGGSYLMRLGSSATGGTTADGLEFIYGDGAAKGSIRWNSTTTAYNTSSDYRLKENIQPMTGALAKVSALKPCTYKWKVDGSDGEGFIAHELAEVAPQCVTGEKDAVDAEGNPQHQGIDTSFLIATLTAAIQELKAINDAQAQTITALTARVTALEGTQP